MKRAPSTLGGLESSWAAGFVPPLDGCSNLAPLVSPPPLASMAVSGPRQGYRRGAVCLRKGHSLAWICPRDMPVPETVGNGWAEGQTEGGGSRHFVKE